MTKSRERSFICLLHFCEIVRPIGAPASDGDRNEGEKNISESESSDSDDYHMLITDFIERYYLCKLASLYNTL